MNRASPVELRKSMDAATTFTKAGLLFVAVPVMNSDDHAYLAGLAQERLNQILREAEEAEAHEQS